MKYVSIFNNKQPLTKRYKYNVIDQIINNNDVTNDRIYFR